jgi:hypothetical protein
MITFDLDVAGSKLQLIMASPMKLPHQHHCQGLLHHACIASILHSRIICCVIVTSDIRRPVHLALHVATGVATCTQCTSASHILLTTRLFISMLSNDGECPRHMQQALHAPPLHAELGCMCSQPGASTHPQAIRKPPQPGVQLATAGACQHCWLHDQVAERCG